MQRKAGEELLVLKLVVGHHSNFTVINIIIRKTGAEKFDVADAFRSAEDRHVIRGLGAASSIRSQHLTPSAPMSLNQRFGTASEEHSLSNPARHRSPIGVPSVLQRWSQSIRTNWLAHARIPSSPFATDSMLARHTTCTAACRRCASCVRTRFEVARDCRPLRGVRPQVIGHAFLRPAVCLEPRPQRFAAGVDYGRLANSVRQSWSMTAAG